MNQLIVVSRGFIRGAVNVATLYRARCKLEKIVTLRVMGIVFASFWAHAVARTHDNQDGQIED